MLNILQIDFMNPSDIIKCSEDHVKDFIKYSVELIKNTNAGIIQDLKYFKPQKLKYQLLINQILSKCTTLYKFVKTLEDLTNTSLGFCIRFQKERENGVKTFLDLLTDEYLIQMMMKNKDNYIVDYINDRNYFYSNYVLLNLSKAEYKFKKIWSDLNAFSSLMNLSKRFQNTKFKNNEIFALVNIMTISDIATDENLNNLLVSPNLLANLIQRLQNFAQILSKEIVGLVMGTQVKRESYQIDETGDLYEFLEDEDNFSIYECLLALYKFSINDKFKISLYETFQLKPILVKVITHGNFCEKEHSFRLLNQLCFMEKISADVGNDIELMNTMKEIIGNKDTTNQRLIKYVKNIQWIINEKGKSKKVSTEELKHVFISYNAGSRKACLEIKKFLETLGHKVWIDTENIHGSSIDAMAKGIEESWCILICMSSKYKESINCRSEAEYVLQIKKPYVPLIMEKSYKPDGWLVFTFHSLILYKFDLIF